MHQAKSDGDQMCFSELRQKEVINCRDCVRLGYVVDLEFDPCSGRIQKIIVPGPGRFFGCFCTCRQYVIPFCKIVRIGPDIVLVDVDVEEVLIKCE